MGNYVYGDSREVIDVAEKAEAHETPQKSVRYEAPQKPADVPRKTGETKIAVEDGVWKIAVYVGIKSNNDNTESSCEFPVYVPMFTDKTNAETLEDCNIILDKVPKCNTYGQIHELFEHLGGNFTIPTGSETQLHAHGISIGHSQFNEISHQICRIANEVKNSLVKEKMREVATEAATEAATDDATPQKELTKHHVAAKSKTA